MINLAKNPAGMNVSLSVGDQLKEKVYVISLNDNALMAEIHLGFTMQILKSYVIKI